MTLAHVAVFTWLEAAMARFWAAETPETGLADHFASLYRAAFWLSAAFIPLVILGLMLWPVEPAFRLALRRRPDRRARPQPRQAGAGAVPRRGRGRRKRRASTWPPSSAAS